MGFHVKVKHIKNFIIAIPIAMIMWMLFGFNTNNVDMINYERRFYYGTTEFAESGFNAIINICKYFGVSSYQGFLGAVSLFLIVAIFFCTLKFTDNAISALLLFCLYPFVLFCIEVRFSIAFCTVLIAILILLKDSRYSIPIFIGLALLATMFHSSSLLYLILIFHKVKINHKNKLYIMIAAAVLGIVVTYTPLALYFASWVSGGSDKITQWFTRRGRFGMAIPIIQQLVSFIIFKYANQLRQKWKIETSLNADVLYDLNILMFILVPCYFINNTFFRLYRIIIFVNTLFFSEIIYNKSNDNQWKVTKLGMLNTFQILFLSFYEIFSRPNVWMPIFQDNLLIEKISEYFCIF